MLCFCIYNNPSKVDQVSSNNPYSPPLAGANATHATDAAPVVSSVLGETWRGAKYGAKMAGIPLCLLFAGVLIPFVWMNLRTPADLLSPDQLYQLFAFAAMVLFGIAPFVLCCAVVGALTIGLARLFGLGRK